MGLSSSKSRTSTSSSQTGQETSSGTQMPVTPAWLEQAAMDYVDRIGAFGERDPMSFVAAASPLQQAAWQNAGRLSDWQGQARTAAELALAGGRRDANLAGAVPLAQAFTYRAPETGSAALVTGQGYSAPDLAPSQGYATPALGAAQGYAAARTGRPIGAVAQGYTAQPATSTTIAPTANATAASLLTNLPAYQNPYTSDIVNAALAEFDQGAAEQQARLAAQGAKSRAFGGSRFGIAEGQLAADLARDRAATSAGLRDQGFRTAAELALSDAGFRQQASLANANAANERARAQANLDQAGALFNADAVNRAREFGTAAANEASRLNATEANRFALDQAGRTDAASRATADAGNQFALSRAGLQADSSRFAADAANQFALARAGLQADAARFGADAANRAAGLNADARNQFALAQAQLAAQAAREGAAARQQASQFNSGLAADLARFDAGQQETAAARQLQAAGLLGSLARDYGAGTRSDLETLAALGDQQRGLEQAYAMAPLAQLEAIGRLSGMTPYDILVGRALDSTSSRSSTGTGTSVTTQSPSLFSQLLDAGNLAARFI